jgi:tetratricopeptide (TPR) repeat protein
VKCRRPAVAILLVCAFHASAAAAQPAAGPGETIERGRLLGEGEALLAAGDANGAQQNFEKATQLLHAADAELSLVRAYMQAGEYRRALAFCAHAAGAHLEVPGGAVLYAWLLNVGGQSRAATATLAQATERAPDDPVLRQGQASLLTSWPTAVGVLAEGPWRAAPYAWGATVPAAARVVGSGVLLASGRAALVPTSLLSETQRIWLRNGLGQTVEGMIEQRLDPVPLTLLQLTQPLATPSDSKVAVREPFGGSPGYTLEYAPEAGDYAAWPLLRQGFFGNVPREGLRLLGIEAPSGGPRGGPVLDAGGRLTGFAIIDAEGRDRLIPLAALPAELSAQVGPAGDTSNVRMPPDEIYERGLRLALQVIVLP